MFNSALVKQSSPRVIRSCCIGQASLQEVHSGCEPLPQTPEVPPRRPGLFSSHGETINTSSMDAGNFKQFRKQGKQTVRMASPLGKTFVLYFIENASMQLKSSGEWAVIELKQVVILFQREPLSSVLSLFCAWARSDFDPFLPNLLWQSYFFLLKFEMIQVLAGTTHSHLAVRTYGWLLSPSNSSQISSPAGLKNISRD